MYVLLIVVSPFVLLLLAIVLSVLLRYTDSDCSFGIFKLEATEPRVPIGYVEVNTSKILRSTPCLG
jgi:hypothetical protein